MTMRTNFSGVVVPLILSVVPGWGHVWLHRKSLGLLVFMVFAAAINLAFVLAVGAFDADRPWLLRVALATAGAAWVFSILDVVRSTLWVRSKSVRARRERLLLRAIGHYLRDELGQAEEQVERLLRIDPRDVAAHTYLGMIRRADGRLNSARKSFHRALECDRDDRWRNDIHDELARTREMTKR